MPADSAAQIRIWPAVRHGPPGWLHARLAFLILVLGCILLVTARVEAGEGEPERLLRLKAEPLPKAPTIDGRLDEWPAGSNSSIAVLDSAAQVHSDTRASWDGPADASARIQLGIHGNSLYLGVRVEDDLPHHDPADAWWHWDSLELFLNTDLEPGKRAPDTYTEGCWQIFLMPLNPEVAWGVVFHGGATHFDAGGLRDLDIAHRLRPGGYDFEVRIPLDALGLTDLGAREIGFAAALNDADTAPRTPGTYLSWNQGQDLYRYPNRFGVLELPAREAPHAPIPAPAGTWPLWSLLAIGLALAAALLLAGPGARWLAGHGPKPKVVGLGLIALLALGLHVERLVSEGRAASGVESHLTDLASRAAAIAGDAQAAGALQEPTAAGRAERLRHLLSGGAIPATPGVDAAAFVPLHPEGAFQDGGRVVYRLRLDAGFGVTLPERPETDRMRFTINRHRVDRTSVAGRELGQFLFTDVSGAEVQVPLVWPADARTESTRVIDITLPRSARWQSLRFVPASRLGRLTLRGLAALERQPEGAEVAQALVLPGVTDEGIPVLAHARGPDHGLRIPAGERVSLPIPALLGGADRLWLLLQPERAFPDLLGEEVLARVRIEYEVAGRDQVLELENGEHLSAERQPLGWERPRKPQSRVAFRWSDLLGYEYTRIAIPLALDTARRPVQFHIENLGPGGDLRLVAATVVRTTKLAPESKVHLVTDERESADRVHLAEASAAFKPHLDPAEPGAIEHETTLEMGSLPIPLRLEAPARADVRAKQSRTTTALLTCLALGVFLLVLLVVDAADHLRVLSRRLSVGVLAAALVPLAVTIILVDRTNSERVNAAYAERALREAGEIEARFEETVRRTQRAARRLAAHLASSPDTTAPLEIRRLVRLFGGPVLPEGAAGSAIVSGSDLTTLHVPLGSPHRRLKGTRFLPGATDGGGFHVSPWDGLVAMASAQRGRGDRRVQVTLGLSTTHAMLEHALGAAAEGSGASAALVDEAGHLLAFAGKHGADLGRGPLPEGRRRVESRRAGEHQNYLAAALPLRRVDQAGGQGAWIVLGFPRSTIEAELATQRETLIWLALFGLVLIVGVASLMARRVSSPVRALVRATDAVRGGSFDAAVTPTSVDEIGELTLAFDQMRLDLKHRVGDLDFLRRAQDSLSASLDISHTARQALDLFREQSAADEAVLLSVQGYGTSVHVLAAHGAAAQFGERPFEPGPGGWIAAALTDEEVRLVHHETDRLLVEAEQGPARRLVQDLGAWLTVPLTHGRERQGLVVLGWRAPDDLPDSRRQRLLVPLAGAVSVALHNARLYRLAALDDVTRLPGATAFEAALRDDVEGALAGGRNAVLLRVGLDHLEHVTLRRGVEASRLLLRACADAMRGIIGDRSKLGRLRGEELAVRLLGADAEEVRRVAEAIRERISNVLVSPDLGGEPLITSASIGIARAPEDAKSVEFLLDAAGRAASAAKREGGDRVETITRVEQGAVEMPPFEEGAIFRNERMVRVVESARRAARSDASILITGETGTGKEVIATLVHRRSARADRPLVTVNCAAFPETLLESELFGHERGAFTGAERRREGRFELADGGTLFLDEVAEMTPSAQVRLLRVLQERQFTRLGGTRTITVDVRIIAATNRDLEQAVADQSFREDLYYRLNVIRLALPPLRDRREEIPFLVEKFLNDFQRRSGRGPRALSPAAMDVLYRHPWPGNVRELKNAIERCAVLCEDDVVGAEHLQFDSTHAASVSSLTPRSAPQDDLNARQRALLEYLARNGRATNRVYYEMTGTSPRTALRDLQDLIERGLIVREGKRRGAIYRLA